MQVRALLDAATKLRAAGGNPIVEIMIPLTVTREEMALARSWVETEIEDEFQGVREPPEVTIGTMIETPRAALRADEIAEVSDFFSFGTNDLTQMAFGFSRDDIESRMMPAYLEQGLLERNPFETIDRGGVGELVKIGAERGRQTKPEAEARRVRRARRRSRVDRAVLRGRSRLRELLAVPRADRPSRRRPGDRRGGRVDQVARRSAGSVQRMEIATRHTPGVRRGPTDARRRRAGSGRIRGDDGHVGRRDAGVEGRGRRHEVAQAGRPRR